MSKNSGYTKEKGITLGTWNLQGLNEEGAIINLVEEIKKYDMDIVALQETHLMTNDIMEVRGYILYNSGGKTRTFGTGFLVKKSIITTVKTFQPISDKLCYLTIDIKNTKMTVVNLHAPTEEKEEEQKDTFYEELENVLDKLPRNNIQIVIGDVNAKIGKEDMFKSITGGESKHQESNDNGLRLINFAIERNMKIMSTHFKRREIYKGTWIIPGTNQANQIDHVLIQEKYARLINNVRTYRGADANSDHFLVGIKMNNLKINKKIERKKRKQKYNMEQLKEETTARKYKKEVSDKYNMQKSADNSIEGMWEKMEQIITEATTNNLEKVKKKKKTEWLDQRCKKEIQKRKILRQTFLQTGQERDKQKYQDQKKKTKKMCRAQKRKYEENKIIEIEDKYKRQDIRNFYRDIKDVRKSFQSHPVHYKDKEGNLIGEEEDIIKRWEQYFKELLNDGTDTTNPIQYQATVENEDSGISEPTKEEIDTIIDCLKNNKSPGQSGITGENIKYGGEILRQNVHKLIKEVWHQEVMPREWNKAIILPIFKKGDKTECSNYRGIALLDVTYKVLATWLKRKLEEKAEGKLGEYQGGFRKNRATTDQIFTLKQVLTTCYEYEIPVHMLFVDFERAYDSVIRQELINALYDLQIPGKLIKLIGMTLSQTVNAVRVNGNVSQEFEVNKGLRQGDPLSTLLFNMVLEIIIRESGINRKGTLLNKSHQCLAYADDLVLLARNKRELKEVTRQLIETAKKRGLKINQSKSKYMQLKMNFKKKDEDGLNVTMAEERLEFNEVDEYMYLGALISDKCEEEKEVKLRIAKSNRCAGGLHKIFNSKNVSLKTKTRLYKTVLRPTLLYGSETWVMNKKTQNMIELWERKILRRIHGGKKTEIGWERRTNKELYELFREPVISDVIKAKRLQWAGHLERMSEERIVKTVGWKEPEGKKKKGRPRRKWREAIMQDLEEKRIQGWRSTAKDRKQWKEVTKLWA